MIIQVTKADGTKEPFSEAKIRASATRVGVPEDLQTTMLKEIKRSLYPDITTKKIFDTIRSYLRSSPEPYLASKYNLKSALAELGPSGYPFEQYIGQLLLAHGYMVKTNQIIVGSCIAHEVDVVAVMGEITHFVEAKFHSKPAQRSDVKVPLYIRARYEDLAAKNGGQTVPWIITNTRFTSEAVKYGQCRGIKLTSWGHPVGEGIMDMIEKVGLHPITIIESLSKEDLQLLFSQNIVVCRQLLSDKQAASLLPGNRRQAILTEAQAICQSYSS